MCEIRSAAWRIKIQGAQLQHLFGEITPSKGHIRTREWLKNESVENDRPKCQIEQSPRSHLGKASKRRGLRYGKASNRNQSSGTRNDPQPDREVRHRTRR